MVRHVLSIIARPLATTALAAALCLASAANAQLTAQDDRNGEAVATAKRLPGIPGSIIRLADQTMVVKSTVDDSRSGRVYRSLFIASPHNPLQWRDTALDGPRPPTTGFFSAVGGDRNRLFFLYEDDIAGHEHVLQLYVLARGTDEATALPGAPLPATRRSLASFSAHFASARVGAISVDSALHLTTDAGKSWHRVQVFEDTRKWSGVIASVRWMDEARLLIASKEGVLKLLAREDDALHELWKIDIPPSAWRSAILVDADDPQYVWLNGGGRLTRIDLATGAIAGAINPEVSYDGAGLCHGRVLVWSYERTDQQEQLRLPVVMRRNAISRIDIWERANERNYARLATVDISNTVLPSGGEPAARGVAPLEGSDCLVFMHSGEAALLNVTTREFGPLVDLQVEMAPSPFPPEPTQEQWRIYSQLLRTLPQDQQMAVIAEFALRYDLSPQERIKLGTKRARDALAGVNPIYVDDPARATFERVNLVRQIAEQLPEEVQHDIAARAFSQTNLTHREQVDWAAQQMLKVAMETLDEFKRKRIEGLVEQLELRKPPKK